MFLKACGGAAGDQIGGTDAVASDVVADGGNRLRHGKREPPL